MSQEARIERHLMRQRGAGPRAVKAEFGFAFPFASIVPTQQDTLPEPPAKRRKVIDQDGIVESTAISQPEVPRSIEVEIVVKAPAGKRDRKRKLLDIECTAEAAPPPVHDDNDDSFVTGLRTGTRTTRARRAPHGNVETKTVKRVVARKPKAVQTPSPMEQDAAPAIARSRPGRQAAMDAVEKVTTSLADEAMPVDKLRRYAAANRPTMKFGKQETVAEVAIASPVAPLLDPRIVYTAKLTASLAAAAKLRSEVAPRRRKPAGRIALRETDANIIRTSLSPAKGGKMRQAAPDQASIISGVLHQRNGSRPKSRSPRSLTVTPEEMQCEEGTARPTSRKIVAARKAAVAVEPSSTEATQGIPVPTATQSSRTIAATSTTKSKTKRRVATEDDLDQLFAAQGTKAKSKSVPKPSRPAKPKAIPKIPGRACRDMDVDDALETVAALARS